MARRQPPNSCQQTTNWINQQASVLGVKCLATYAGSDSGRGWGFAVGDFPARFAFAFDFLVPFFFATLFGGDFFGDLFFGNFLCGVFSRPAVKKKKKKKKTKKKNKKRKKKKKTNIASSHSQCQIFVPTDGRHMTAQQLL